MSSGVDSAGECYRFYRDSFGRPPSVQELWAWIHKISAGKETPT